MLGLAVARALGQQANHQIPRGQHILQIALDHAAALGQRLRRLTRRAGIQLHVFPRGHAKPVVAALPQLGKRGCAHDRGRWRHRQRHVRSMGGRFGGRVRGLGRHDFASIGKITDGIQPHGLNGLELAIGNNAETIDGKGMAHPADFQLDVHAYSQGLRIDQDRGVHT
ncbi:hypothetical protein D3C86_1663370 [compost metagenome]